MSNFFVMHEGMRIDHAGNNILSTYIDFREQSYRVPMTALIKGCKKQYAIELCKKIRISKPELFRRYGEELISDPSEAKISNTQVSEKHNDPQDIAEAQAEDDKLSQAFEILGIPAKFKTNDIKIANTRTQYLSSHKNGWIFSTSLLPANHAEEDKWQKSMPNGYDHVTRIHRPREFAHALGAMVAEQLGPRCKEDTINHSIDGYKFKTRHKTQVVYHGPVTYEKDPFARLCETSTETESMLLPLFIKRYGYKDQQEYRFYIHTEEEPSEETVDLDVSLAMLGAITEPYKNASSLVFPPVLPFGSPTDPKTRDDACDSIVEKMRAFANDNEQSSASDPSDLNSVMADPSFPVAPSTSDADDPQQAGRGTTAAHSAIEELRNRIEMLMGMKSIPENEHALVKSSAWNADYCIRRLCNAFDDPIKDMSIKNTCVLIRIKFPHENNTEAKVLIGPHNVNGYKIVAGNKTGYDVERNWPIDLFVNKAIEHLKEYGL